MFADLEAVITTVNSQLTSISGRVETPVVENACDMASKETGVVFPLFNNKEEYWLVQRAVRHVIADLRLQNSPKFKINSMHLNQRFDHYTKLVEEYDLKFKEALEEDPSLFPSMSSSSSSGNSDFITYIPTI